MEVHAMIYSRCTCGPAVSKMAIWPLPLHWLDSWNSHLKREWSKMLPSWGHSFGRNIRHYKIIYCSFVYNAAFPDFALDVSTEVEVGISCGDGQWFHCIACIWWERHTSNAAPRSLFIFHGNQIPCFLTTIDYQYSMNKRQFMSCCADYSRLNQLERSYATRSKASFEKWSATCGDMD